jgi:DNA-binding response OmpR family regulator
MRILIVDDDAGINSALKAQLEAEHFAVDTTDNGEDGSFKARTNNYDLVILDSSLPKKTGPEVCILFLTVNSEIADKVTALNLGADDYLTKPFSFQELIARVRALLRRPAQTESDILTFQDLTMDVNSHIVTRQKQPIYLTRKEFMLLEYMLRHKGQTVSRSELLEHVWDAKANVFSNTIESHIVSLRKKIDGPNKKKLIHTISGRGYKIDLKK